MYVSLGGRFKDIAHEFANKQTCAASLYHLFFAVVRTANGPPEALVALRAGCSSANDNKQAGAYFDDNRPFLSILVGLSKETTIHLQQ